MKIGIFAGTFDPIHKGHLAFAEAAVKEAGLDKVIIVAEKDPYRKKPHTSWDHRQAMIERATKDLEQVDHDYHFASKLAHQHTMQNMLSVAKEHYGQENEFWFLVGSDIYEHMHHWKDLVSHEEYGGFVVALRKDHNELWLDEQQRTLQNPPYKIIIKNPYPSISSGKIRTALQLSKSSPDIAAQVATYIHEHHLYER